MVAYPVTEAWASLGLKTVWRFYEKRYRVLGHHAISEDRNQRQTDAAAAVVLYTKYREILNTLYPCEMKTFNRPNCNNAVLFI